MPVVADREERVRAERIRGHEHLRLRPPERDLLPAFRPLDLDHLERRSRQRFRNARDEARRAARARAAASRLCRSRSWITPAGVPSDEARSIASGQSTGSMSQTPSPVASACDVRVMGSSTIHENPWRPRSSQKRIVMPGERSDAPVRSTPAAGVVSSLRVRHALPMRFFFRLFVLARDRARRDPVHPVRARSLEPADGAGDQVEHAADARARARRAALPATPT